MSSGRKYPSSSSSYPSHPGNNYGSGSVNNYGDSSSYYEGHRNAWSRPNYAGPVWGSESGGYDGDYPNNWNSHHYDGGWNYRQQPPHHQYNDGYMNNGYEGSAYDHYNGGDYSSYSKPGYNQLSRGPPHPRNPDVDYYRHPPRQALADAVAHALKSQMRGGGRPVSTD